MMIVDDNEDDNYDDNDNNNHIDIYKGKPQPSHVSHCNDYILVIMMVINHINDDDHHKLMLPGLQLPSNTAGTLGPGKWHWYCYFGN